MNRREFLSFAPFLGVFPKPKMETDFDSFKTFVKSFKDNMPEKELRDHFYQEDSSYKILWKAVVKKIDVQLFYLTPDRIVRVIEPLENNPRIYKSILSFIDKPEGYIITIFKSEKVVGKIQFIRI